MAHQDAIWLGTPISVAAEDLKSPCVSRVGGTAVLFREMTESTTFHCPKCNKSNAVSLLAQIFAPLESYDRVIYVFVCGTCSKKDSSFCFVFRSQNFNPSYVAVPQVDAVVVDGADSDRLFFEEDNDWGSDTDNGWGKSISKRSDMAENASEIHGDNDIDFIPMPREDTNSKVECAFSEPSPLASLGSKLPVRGVCYPCFGLDIFEEPLKIKTKGTVPIKDQLYEVQKKYGDDVVDLTPEAGEEEEGQEALHDKCLRKYVERIGRVPSQCIRWGPNQEPLRSSVVPIVAPNCPYCKSKRRYELQLTSPIIYFLTKTSEKSHALHFGNVLVFTCAENCNEKAYALEYCVVEVEI